MIYSLLLVVLCFALIFGRVQFMINELNRQIHIVDRYKISFGAISTTQPESWWRSARVVGLSFESCKKKIDKDDLAAIGELNHLEHLSFRNTSIDDDVLSHISGLTSLRYLNLQGTHITDDGLIHLAGLPKLERLILTQTAVTFDGALELQERMPTTYISHLTTWSNEVNRDMMDTQHNNDCDNKEK